MACRRLQDEVRQFAMVSAGQPRSETCSGEILPPAVRDAGIAEATPEDRLVPRWEASSEQQTLLYHSEI